jgi:hypothetical protein
MSTICRTNGIYILLTTSRITAWEQILAPYAPCCDTSNDGSKSEEGSLIKYQRLTVLICRTPTTTKKSQGIHRSLTRWPVARSRGVGMPEKESVCYRMIEAGRGCRICELSWCTQVEKCRKTGRICRFKAAFETRNHLLILPAVRRHTRRHPAIPYRASRNTAFQRPVHSSEKSHTAN